MHQVKINSQFQCSVCLVNKLSGETIHPVILNGNVFTFDDIEYLRLATHNREKVKHYSINVKETMLHVSRKPHNKTECLTCESNVDSLELDLSESKLIIKSSLTNLIDGNYKLMSKLVEVANKFTNLKEISFNLVNQYDFFCSLTSDENTQRIMNELLFSKLQVEKVNLFVPFFADCPFSVDPLFANSNIKVIDVISSNGIFGDKSSLLRVTRSN